MLGLAFALFTAGCSTDQIGLVAADATEAATLDEAEEAVDADEAAGLATTTTTGVVDRASLEVEVLGAAMVGQGEFVRLTAAPGDGDSGETTCTTGWLGFRFDDGEVHVYEDLGAVRHVRLFNGPRGQDALVVSCEETVERVLIQGSAVTAADGIPRFMSFSLDRSYPMDFNADFGWRGDLFGGYANDSGWDELVYFDTATGFVIERHTALGARIDRLGHGFDFVLPDGWDLLEADPQAGDDAGLIEMRAPDESAWISVQSAEWAGDPEFPEGTEPDNFLADTAPLWRYVSADRAVRVGVLDRLTWTVQTPDGPLTVVHIEGGAVDLIVRYSELGEGGGPGGTAVVNAALEQIRSYATTQ